MLVDLWVNLVNILLSLGLGFGLHLGSSLGAGITLLPTLGFAGVAWGTVIAQWTGLSKTVHVQRHQVVETVIRRRNPVEHFLYVFFLGHYGTGS